MSKIGSDKHATWRTTGGLCADRDWSRARLIHELQNGLRYRTIPEVLPEGFAVNWRNSNLNVEASTVVAECYGRRGIGGRLVICRTVGIEVWGGEEPNPTARWAFATTRKLQAEKRVPKQVTQSDLAQLLATESQGAAKTGHLKRPLKKSYLENQLVAWGVWPL